MAVALNVAISILATLAIWHWLYIFAKSPEEIQKNPAVVFGTLVFTILAIAAITWRLSI